MKTAPGLVAARLRKLQAHLAVVPPENFDMSNFRCGTAACVAGHAVVVFPELLQWSPAGDIPESRSAPDAVRHVGVLAALGVTLNESYELCDAGALHQTPLEASAAVGRLAEEYEASSRQTAASTP